MSNSPCILIVEDENIVALDIERGLKRLGYNTLGTVNNGAAALEAIEKNRPTLILMDIQIKGEIDGIDTAVKVRDLYNIPVVFLTAHADEATLQRAKNADPYGYLLKPFEETELHTVIQVALKKFLTVEEQRKIAEKRIQESEERFEILVTSVRDYAICILNLDGKIVSWNAGAERIFGYSKDEVVGLHLSIFSSDDDISSKLPAWSLQEAKVSGTFADEGWRLRKGHTRFWAHVTLTRLKDRSDLHIGYAMITRDLTERKRSEDRLRLVNEGLEARVQDRTAKLTEALQIRDEFLSIASHELKNPLATMCLQIHLLTKHIKSFLDTKERPSEVALNKLAVSIDCCERQSKRLVTLIDQLLDLTRIRIGKLELRKELMDLPELISHVVEVQKSSETSPAIEFMIPKESIIGRWDRSRLEQILTNLISNAVKYGNKSNIEIQTKYENDRQSAQFTVRDHGPGIPLDMQTKIFEKFQRVPNASGAAGLGLGLYIVRQIVEAHGGHIYVQSLPGEGASFIVDIPTGLTSVAQAGGPIAEAHF